MIATSDPVLAGALPKVSPPMSSLQALGDRISVAALDGSDVLSITATGKTADQAEDTANAVANSYIAYVSAARPTPPCTWWPRWSSRRQPRPGPSCQSTSAYTPSWARSPAHSSVSSSAWRTGRSNRRLVQRDEIANSIAVPVLASIPVERPSDPASWARLLEEYEPDPVHAYGLSKLLRQFGVGDYDRRHEQRARSSLTVLSLASDPTALALGPQLAAFASARGIPTALVVGPQQDMNVTASLRTVCAAGAQTASGHGKPLRLLVAEDGRVGQVGAAFTVVVRGDRRAGSPRSAHGSARPRRCWESRPAGQPLRSSPGSPPRLPPTGATSTASSWRTRIQMTRRQAGFRVWRRCERALPTRVNGLATEIRR